MPADYDGSTQGVFATDPDAFTKPWLERRAAAFAADARALILQLREYEAVHPSDAPCLLPLLGAQADVEWRGHARP